MASVRMVSIARESRSGFTGGHGVDSDADLETDGRRRVWAATMWAAIVGRAPGSTARLPSGHASPSTATAPSPRPAEASRPPVWRVGADRRPGRRRPAPRPAARRPRSTGGGTVGSGDVAVAGEGSAWRDGSGAAGRAERRRTATYNDVPVPLTPRETPELPDDRRDARPRPPCHRPRPHPRDRRRPAGELRASGCPDGRAPMAYALWTRSSATRRKTRSGRTATVRALGRPRQHAALLAAPPDRLRPAARRTQALPPVGRRTPGHPECGPRPESRRPPARSDRDSPTPSAWRSPSAGSPPSSTGRPRRSSTTGPTGSPRTATCRKGHSEAAPSPATSGSASWSSSTTTTRSRSTAPRPGPGRRT